MYIKQLTISGFKSYGEPTVIGPLSKGYNVVVGKNGAGKSNFFAAIRFVLNDAYTKLGPEDRISLMHDTDFNPSAANTLSNGQHGSIPISSYVEVIFDNTDSRFPTGRSETVIKRTLTKDSDEMFLDGKPITKTELSSFLQAAGFSKSNPYYIVPQGRITALTNARDEDRLSLLKEIAGTTLYESHRSESLKILQESQSRQEKISELLTSIDERVMELEDEKKRMQAMEEEDEVRRAKEYTLLSREQAEIQTALESLIAIEVQTRTEPQNAEIKKQISELEEKLRHVETEYQRNKQNLALTQALVDAQEKMAREQRHLVTSNECFPCQTFSIVDSEFPSMSISNSLNDSISNNFSTSHPPLLEVSSLSIEALEDERSMLLMEKKEKYIQLNQCNLRLAEIKSQEHQLREKLSSLRSLVELGLGIKSSSDPKLSHGLNKEKSDKDNQYFFIDIQKRTEESIALKESLIHEKDCSYRQELQRLVELEQLELELKSQLTDYDNQLTISLQGAQEERSKGDKVAGARRNLWREQAKLRSVLPHLQEELLNTERALFECIPEKATAIGLSNLRRLCQELNLQPTDVLGPFCELFKVIDSVYDVAIEAMAGSALYHVVVKDDSIATMLLNALSSQRAGRLTFVPLNRLHKSTFGGELFLEESGQHNISPSSSHQIESITTRDTRSASVNLNLPESISLAEVVVPVEGDLRLRSFLKNFFGRGLVVETLEDASKIFQTEKKFTILTLDGDRLDKRGAMTGGYNRSAHISKNTSPLELVRSILSIRDKIQQLMVLMQNADESPLERESSDISGRLLQMEVKIKELMALTNSLKQRLEELNSATIPATKANLRAMQAEIEQIRAERSVLDSRLTLIQNFKNKSTGTSINTIDDHLVPKPEYKSDTIAQLNPEIILEEIPVVEKALLDITLQAPSLFEACEKLRQELQLRIESRLSLIELNLLPTARRNQSLKEQVSTQWKQEKIQSLLSLEEAEQLLNTLKEDLNRITSAISNALQEKEAFERDLEIMLQYSSKDTAAKIEQSSKRSMLTTRLGEIDRRIRELGHIPSDRLESFRSEPSSMLRKSLSMEKGKENSRLTQVNRRVNDQYLALVKQRTILINRRKELRDSHTSISEYISTLDMQKDAVVLRTFESVSLAFSEVFSTLVPSGTAFLRLVRSIVNDDRSITEERPMAEWSGIAIDACFVSILATEDHSTSIDIGYRYIEPTPPSSTSLFSGGQKSLLACALILAIQRCDPAPFYLFDEIDANLDPQYRASLAGMISQLSYGGVPDKIQPASQIGLNSAQSNVIEGAIDEEGNRSIMDQENTRLAQFLVTTFRPELAVKADKFFGISLDGRVSRIQEIDCATALQFISHE